MLKESLFMNVWPIVFAGVFLWTLGLGTRAGWTLQLNLGYSGTGLNSTLRRVIEKERLWQKRGLDIRSVYFNNGTVTA